MTSPVSESVGSTANIHIVPEAYIKTASKRKSVKDLKNMPKDELKKHVKACNTAEQQVIIQDLLIAAGIKLETKENMSLVSLAADLFVWSSEDTKNDFFNHVKCIEYLFNNFVSAITTNHIFHKGIEYMRKGSSGLTDQELNDEERWAKKLN